MLVDVSLLSQVTINEPFCVSRWLLMRSENYVRQGWLTSFKEMINFGLQNLVKIQTEIIILMTFS